MSKVTEQPESQVFENPNPDSGDPTMFFLGGIGLIVFAIVGFAAAIMIQRGQLFLHATTTLPLILAVGMLARGFSLRSLPSRIILGPDSIEVTARKSTREYPWSEIGSAVTANVMNSQLSCLKITDTRGKTIIQVDESFPNYQRLVKLVQARVDAKPDDTSIRILARKARWMGLLSFTFGSFMALAAIFIAIETRGKQRADELLATQGVSGEGEIVRRFLAPNGVTRRIEYRVAGGELQNVEVEPMYWAQLEDAKTVPVTYVPNEPNISRLEKGEVIEDDFTKTPMGGYILSGLGCLMALFAIGYSPFAWKGYDLAYDKEEGAWKLKKYGRVVWASREEDEDDY